MPSRSTRLSGEIVAPTASRPAARQITGSSREERFLACVHSGVGSGFGEVWDRRPRGGRLRRARPIEGPPVPREAPTRDPRRLQSAVVTASHIDGQLTIDAWRAPGAPPIAVSEDGLALKGLTPTATIPADPDVESCLASTRARRFFTGKSSTGQRHDDTGSPLPDHTCQFQAHPLLGRNGDRLAVDELAQHLDFQITQFGRASAAPTVTSSAVPAPAAPQSLPASWRLHPALHRLPTLQPLAMP